MSMSMSTSMSMSMQGQWQKEGISGLPFRFSASLRSSWGVDRDLGRGSLPQAMLQKVATIFDPLGGFFPTRGFRISTCGIHPSLVQF